MKLLFDENISHRILKKLKTEYESCMHCKNIKPYPKSDIDIWNYAKDKEFTIVSFDEDFYDWMILKGFPPKIIWLRSGNISTNEIANLLNNKFDEIINSLSNEEVGIIELY